MNDFYRAALDIAERKLCFDDNPTLFKSPRLGTGGNFTDIFLWDTAFSVQWAKYHTDRFPVANSLDNFYLSQEEDGFISRQIHPDGRSKWSKFHPISFAPPLLGWAELELQEGGFLTGRLSRVFEPLLRQHRFNMAHFRREDGLFFSNCWGCGMDDIPRWDDPAEVASEGGIPWTRDVVTDPGPAGDTFFQEFRNHPRYNHSWNRQLGWCDTSCQMAFNALILSRIARVLGRDADAAMLQREHDEIADRINDLCYDEKKRFYFDRLGDRLLSRRHIGAYWALLAEVAPPDRAEGLIAELRNPARFDRPCGIPSLAADDPDFNLETGYWRGQVWCPTVYMTLRGLRLYNEEKLARQIADRFYRATRRIWENTGTIWENYSPDQCETPSPSAGRDFCGWSALAPISIYREFLC